MIEGLQVVLERFTADCYALLDHQRGLHGAEGVAFDRVRSVGEFDVVIMLKIAHRLGG